MSQKNNNGGSIFPLILIIIILAVAFSSCTSDTSTSTSTHSSSGLSSEKCQSCKKSFTDFDNIKSIKHTNMCKNCTSNYKFAKDALGEEY